MLKKINWAPLALFVIAVELIGLLCGVVSGDVAGIYEVACKPPLSVPGWLFNLAWPLVYAAIGVALYLAHQSCACDEEKKQAFIATGTPLILNLLWGIIFFRFGLVWAAFVIGLALAVASWQAMRRIKEVDPLAGKLMLAYLTWVVYILYLNLGFIIVN